jgi:hypothetical protein
VDWQDRIRLGLPYWTGAVFLILGTYDIAATGTAVSYTFILRGGVYSTVGKLDDGGFAARRLVARHSNLE